MRLASTASARPTRAGRFDPGTLRSLARPTAAPVAARRRGTGGSMPRKPADLRTRERDVEIEVLVPKAAADAGAGADAGRSQAAPHTLTPVLFAVFWAAMGAFSFGYHLGVVNGPLEAIAADLGFAGNAALQGTVVSSCLAGAAAGSLSGSGLADSLGRRGALILSALPVIAGALLSATASGLAGMVAGRVAVGVGIGLSSALVPLYISEVSPTRVRGTLGSLNQLVICIGILAALLVNVAVDATQWRTMFALAVIPALLLVLGMLLSPESPRWLQGRGRAAAAAAAAGKLWGPSGSSQLGEGGGGGGGGAAPEAASFGALLRCKGAWIGVVLFAAQQCSGVNSVIYFSSSTFAAAGVQSGELATAVVGGINVLGTVVAASLMDRFGRKQLLSLSFSGMAASMLALASGLGLAAFAGVKGTIALVGTVAYIAFFALGAGAVPGLLVPEITPAHLRGMAVSLALAVHWVFNYGIGLLFLPAVARFGLPAVYLFFAAVCAATVAYTRSQVVETKGLSLEEVQKRLSM